MLITMQQTARAYILKCCQPCGTNCLTRSRNMGPAGILLAHLAVMRWALQARLRSHGGPADRATAQFAVIIASALAWSGGTVSWALQAGLAARSLLPSALLRTVALANPALLPTVMATMWCQHFAASAVGSSGRKLTWGDGHCVVCPAGQCPHIPALEDLHLGWHLLLLPHALPNLAQIVLAPSEYLPCSADACCMPLAKAERSPPAHNLQVQWGLSWQLAGLRKGPGGDTSQCIAAADC